MNKKLGILGRLFNAADTDRAAEIIYKLLAKESEGSMKILDDEQLQFMFESDEFVEEFWTWLGARLEKFKQEK